MGRQVLVRSQAHAPVLASPAETTIYRWTYIDSRVNQIFNFRFNDNKPFFERGGYPSTVFNGTQEVRLENPWAGSDKPGVAPFDQCASRAEAQHARGR